MRITWAVAALLIGVLFVVGACTSLAAPTTLAPAIIAPVTPTPVATPTPAPLTPAPVTIPASTMLAPQPVPVPGSNEGWLRGGEYRPNRMTVPLGATVIGIGKDYDPHDVEGKNFFCSLPLGVLTIPSPSLAPSSITASATPVWKVRLL